MREVTEQWADEEPSSPPVAHAEERPPPAGTPADDEPAAAWLAPDVQPPPEPPADERPADEQPPAEHAADEQPADERAPQPAKTGGAPDGAVQARPRSHAGMKPGPGRPGPSRPSHRRPDTEAAVGTPEEGPTDRRLTGALLIVVLLLVTVVFGAAAIFFRGEAARASTGSAENRAVVDTAATSEAVGQVSKAIEVVLSYDYTKLDENERASREVITGKYAEEFDKTFADIRKVSPEQKLVVTTTVLLAGVTILNDDRAELIATMDLAAVRDTTPYNSPGRVKVVATKVDGRWKIAEMQLL